MRIGEATRIAMREDAPVGKPVTKPGSLAKSATADLEAETRQLLAAIRGGGSLGRAKLSKTDSSIKTEDLEPSSARRRGKKKGKKGVKAPIEAFVRTKTPPTIHWVTPGAVRGAHPPVRSTVELADDESTPRSLGSDRDSVDSGPGEPLSRLTEADRARLREEEEALRELDFGAEEVGARVCACTGGG